MNIDDAIALYLRYISSEARLAAGTVANYRADLADFADFLRQQHIVQLADIDARQVRSWQMLHMDRGEAPGTVKRRLSSLRSCFRYLRRHGLLEADVMAQVAAPRQPKRLPVFFKEKEVERLYDDGLFADDFAGRRDALLLRLLYETGIRRAEVIGLREAAVDFSALTVKVLGKRNKERLVPIEPELAASIRQFLQLKHEAFGPSEWLLVSNRGQQLSPSMVYRTVRRYMSLLSSADRISPHVFRHSFATHILDNGGNLQAIKELLGHADLATTEVYTHVTRERLKEVYRQAHPRSRKKTI